MPFPHSVSVPDGFPLKIEHKASIFANCEVVKIDLLVLPISILNVHLLACFPTQETNRGIVA